MFEYTNFLIILKELKKRGITKFNLSDLENDLYILKKNPKYECLFTNIKEKINKLDLSYFINKAEKEGYIVSLDYDMNIKYMTKMNIDKENELIKELVKEYIEQKNIYKKENIKIYKIDSNNTYKLIKKKNINKVITLNVITDGKIKSVKKDKLNNEVVDIEASTYAVEQKIVNNKLDNLIIYTMIEEQLDEIIEYSTQNIMKEKTLIIKKF
ncbi:MAG: hypothetical protein J6K21_02330 [Bacilli bacterium]|nr:hypothetical protein [Bacilli bacterium]